MFSLRQPFSNGYVRLIIVTVIPWVSFWSYLAVRAFQEANALRDQAEAMQLDVHIGTISYVPIFIAADQSSANADRFLYIAFGVPLLLLLVCVAFIWVKQGFSKPS